MGLDVTPRRRGATRWRGLIFSQDASGRRRVALEAIGWADWPFDQVAAAVWANIPKHRLRAVGAKSALIGTNMRPDILRRQVAVAVLAVWP
jgi:hypothetical protein